MNQLSKKNLWTLSIILSFVGMIAINTIANVLPNNGQTTQEISDYYFDLFTPISWIFSIWGIIYLFLFVFVCYQWKYWNNSEPMYRKKCFYQV